MKTKYKYVEGPISPVVMQSLEAILDYMWDAEQKHFAMAHHSNKAEHIFQDVKCVSEWLREHRRDSKLLISRRN